MTPVFQKPAATYEPRGRLDPAGFAKHVQFRTQAPPEDLAAFVEHFWVVTWDASLGSYSSEEVMHRPYVDVFVGAQSGIQGTFRGRRAYLAKGIGRFIGARFRPGAFRAFWKSGALVQLRDKVVPLHDVFPEADKKFVKRLASLDDAAVIEALTAMLRAKQPRPSPGIATLGRIIKAIEAPGGPQTVAEVAAALRKSDRWLQQFFRDHVGLGLKWFLQRRRLLAAAERIRASQTPDFAAIAYDLGYSSQAHFNADFKQALGRTPTLYKRTLGR